MLILFGPGRMTLNFTCHFVGDYFRDMGLGPMLICFPGDFDLKHSVLQGVRSIKPLRLVQWPTAFEMSASSIKK